MFLQYMSIFYQVKMVMFYNVQTTNLVKDEKCSKYTEYDISCHQFYLACSILIANCGIVSPTLNVNPTIFVIPCNFFGGL